MSPVVKFTFAVKKESKKKRNTRIPPDTFISDFYCIVDKKFQKKDLQWNPFLPMKKKRRGSLWKRGKKKGATCLPLSSLSLRWSRNSSLGERVEGRGARKGVWVKAEVWIKGEGEKERGRDGGVEGGRGDKGYWEGAGWEGEA